ncbi:MAG: response regulator [Candidatus Bathyarchaeia archaeon]
MKSRASVLLVDDDKDMTETLYDVLTDMSYRVETANSGSEAIEKVKTHAFDTVLLDIKMPGINGVETFREIKRIRPEAVVMLMTAQSVEELVAEALEEGAYGIMYKPIDTKKLVEFIETTKRGALILFVDVDMSTSQKLVDSLKQSGYNVAKASSGEEAKKLIQRERVDLIFIEVKMPVMNGLEIYMALRKIMPDVRVVMTTNYREGLEDLIDQALHESAYACIYKPFEVGKVIKLLERILAGKTKAEIRQMEEEDDRKSQNSDNRR